MTRIENLEDWIAGKRREVTAEEPLSIQANIAALSQRVWKAERTLEQVRRLVEQWAEREATEGEHVYYRELRHVLAGGDGDE